MINGVKKDLDIHIAAAWDKFHQVWHLPMRRTTNLVKRIWACEANVTRSVLWCCESSTKFAHDWVRLRRFAGPRRALDDDYISWLQRATRKA